MDISIFGIGRWQQKVKMRKKLFSCVLHTTISCVKRVCLQLFQNSCADLIKSGLQGIDLWVLFNEQKHKHCQAAIEAKRSAPTPSWQLNKFDMSKIETKKFILCCVFKCFLVRTSWLNESSHLGLKILLEIVLIKSDFLDFWHFRISFSSNPKQALMLYQDVTLI